MSLKNRIPLDDASLLLDANCLSLAAINMGLQSKELIAFLGNALIFGWCLSGLPLCLACWRKGKYDTNWFGAGLWSLNSLWSMYFLTVIAVRASSSMSVLMVFITFQIFGGLSALIGLWTFLTSPSGRAAGHWTNLVGFANALFVSLATLYAIATADLAV